MTSTDFNQDYYNQDYYNQDYTSFNDELDLAVGLGDDEKLGFHLITFIMVITCITIFIIVLL